MSGQDIALALTLDGTEANATIERFNANQAALVDRAAAATLSLNALQQKQLEMARVQDQLNGGGTKYNETLRLFERQAKETAAAVSAMSGAAAAAGKNTGTLAEQFRSLGQRMAPQAAAISSISSAMGQNAGAAGKAVAAVGQLTSAFAAGGPFGVAVVAGTLVVNALTQAWEDEIDAQNRAISNRADVKTADAQHVISERIAALKKQTGVDTGETEEEAYARLTPAVEAATAALKRFEDAHLARRRTPGDERSVLEAALEQAEKLRMLEAEAARQAHERLSGSSAKTRTVARSASIGAPASGDEDPEIQMMIFRAEMAKKASDAANANMLKAFEDKKAITAKNIDLEKEAAAESLRIMKEQAAEEERVRRQKLDSEAAALKARNDFIASQVQSAAAGLASASQQYLTDRIAGEKHAEERFAASVMAQAGSALVGYGTQAIGMAALSALNPLTAPLAPVQFAGGAALIAAGVGLGAVAPSLNIGGASAAKKDGGVNRSPRQSTRTGQDANSGEVYIFNNYGVSGPLADDQVRALERTQARANRRSMQ